MGRSQRCGLFIVFNSASIVVKNNACMVVYTVVIMQAHFTARVLTHDRRKKISIRKIQGWLGQS